MREKQIEREKEIGIELVDKRMRKRMSGKMLTYIRKSGRGRKI